MPTKPSKLPLTLVVVLKVAHFLLNTVKYVCAEPLSKPHCFDRMCC